VIGLNPDLQTVWFPALYISVCVCSFTSAVSCRCASFEAWRWILNSSFSSANWEKQDMHNYTSTYTIVLLTMAAFIWSKIQ